MFDFHVHAGAVAGKVTVAEVGALARQKGYRACVILARCDALALHALLPLLVRSCRESALFGEGEVLAGVELVHLPPPCFGDAVREARSLGAALVAAHGEYPGSVVPTGTNTAAIQAGIDVLLHPGSISDAEAELAAQLGVALELSLCPGHALFNGHVAATALRHGARLVTGSDARSLTELPPVSMRRLIVRGAGLGEAEADQVDADCLALMTRLLAS